MRNLLVQMPDDLHAYLGTEARKRGVSMAHLVRVSLIAHLQADPSLLTRPEKTGAPEKENDHAA